MIRKRLKYLSICMTGMLWALSPTASMAEDGYGCIRFMLTDYTWGKPHKMPMTVVTGKELFKATEDDRYNLFFNYVVVEDAKGGFEALEIPSVISSLPGEYIETNGHSGRTFRIKTTRPSGECT